MSHRGVFGKAGILQPKLLDPQGKFPIILLTSLKLFYFYFLLVRNLAFTGSRSYFSQKFLGRCCKAPLITMKIITIKSSKYTRQYTPYCNSKREQNCVQKY